MYPTEWLGIVNNKWSAYQERMKREKHHNQGPAAWDHMDKMLEECFVSAPCLLSCSSHILTHHHWALQEGDSKANPFLLNQPVEETKKENKDENKGMESTQSTNEQLPKGEDTTEDLEKKYARIKEEHTRINKELEETEKLLKERKEREETIEQSFAGCLEHLDKKDIPLLFSFLQKKLALNK